MTAANGREPFSDASPDSSSSHSNSSSLPQPRPSKLLMGLLGLALLYTLYFAKSLILPFVIAVLFALLLGPLVALFKRYYVPRPVSAILLITMLLGPFTLLGMELAEPAQRWAKRVPELSEQLTQQLSSITDALQVEKRTSPVQIQPEAEPEPQAGERGFRWFGWFRSSEPEPAPDPSPAPEPVQQQPDDQVSERIKQGGMELVISMLSATPLLIAQFLTTLILILFLLVFGPNLFTAFVDHFPSVREQRQSVVLVRTVQRELSRYILTVSVINFCLGLATGAALWFIGVDDALLWGVMVGLANFAPYIGPIISIGVLSLAGLVQYGPEVAALTPALVYFGINIIEAQFVTPLVLGRNMRLNPLVIMIWLIIWGWLWGAAGVLLAVPLLVCLKLAFGQMHILPDWVRLIETRA